MRNMKKLIIATFLLITAVTLVGCKNSVVTGRISDVYGSRNSISVTIDLTDPDGKLGTSSVYAAIHKKGETSVLNTVSFTGTADEEETKEFSNLEKETEYDIYLYGTYDKKKHTFDKTTVSTTNKGLEENPIEVSTAEEFLNIKKDPSGFFVLKNDIDLGAESITPMFSKSTPFTGGLDGKGFTISNFKLTSSTTYLSVFGCLEKSVIKDVNFDDIKVEVTRSSDIYVAVVAGYNMGELRNVHVTNASFKVTSNGSGIQRIGGLTAINSDGAKIDNCSVTEATFEVTSKNMVYLGGLSGVNAEPSTNKKTPIISNSYTDVEIICDLKSANTTTEKLLIEMYVGGLVGCNLARIEDSYSENTITASSSKASKINENYVAYIGGLAGSSDKSSRLYSSAVKTTISFISADIIEAYIGGLAGKTGNWSDISDCITVNSKITTTVTSSLEEVEESEEEGGEDVITTLENNVFVSLIIAKAVNAEKINKAFYYGTGELVQGEGDITQVVQSQIITDLASLELSEKVLAFIRK